MLCPKIKTRFLFHYETARVPKNAISQTGFAGEERRTRTGRSPKPVAITGSAAPAWSAYGHLLPSVLVYASNC
jgi:hypothetical protein